MVHKHGLDYLVVYYRYINYGSSLAFNGLSIIDSFNRVALSTPYPLLVKSKSIS
jgi:hypothetical protein